MLWLLYASGVVATSIVYVLLSKKILNNEENFDPIAYAAVAFLIVAIYSLIFYVITSFSIRDFASFIDPTHIKIYTIDFILYALAPSIYYRVLKKLPASEVQIIYAFVGFFALLFGVLFGTELFHFLRLIGGIIILSAIYLVTQKNGKWKLEYHALLLILATVLYGGAAVTDNYIITQHFFSIPFFQTIQFGIPALILLAINPKSIKRITPLFKNTKAIWTTAINSFFFFLNYLFIFKAYASGGTTSQVNMFFSLETVFIVIFSAIFLKETTNLKTKLFAGLLATIGVAFLTF